MGNPFAATRTQCATSAEAPVPATSPLLSTSRSSLHGKSSTLQRAGAACLKGKACVRLGAAQAEITCECSTLCLTCTLESSSSLSDSRNRMALNCASRLSACCVLEMFSNELLMKACRHTYTQPLWIVHTRPEAMNLTEFMHTMHSSKGRGTDKEDCNHEGGQLAPAPSACWLYTTMLTELEPIGHPHECRPLE